MHALGSKVAVLMVLVCVFGGVTVGGTNTTTSTTPSVTDSTTVATTTTTHSSVEDTAASPKTAAISSSASVTSSSQTSSSVTTTTASTTTTPTTTTTTTTTTTPPITSVETTSLLSPTTSAAVTSSPMTSASSVPAVSAPPLVNPSSTVVISSVPSSSAQSEVTTSSVASPTTIAPTTSSMVTTSTSPTTPTTPTTIIPDIDECKSNPCNNGSTCNNHNNNYTCTCAPGWEGQNCDANIKECASNPCANGSTCNDHVNNYTCTCAPGWEGRNCSTNINECASNPCANGSTCNDHVNNYTCTCAPGWEGRNCSKNINECASNPCANGATCNDLVNNYTCTCAPGWEGRNCSENIKECDSNPCANGATCNDQINNYTCTCASGWEGRNCSKNINECESKTHNCSKYAECKDTMGSFNCSCKDGFHGDGFMCADINECQHNGVLVCDHGNCINVPGSYRCFCEDGWTGNNCSQDIDECATVKPCSPNATCNNTNGSYTCECHSGYRGDGHECVFEVLITIPSSSRIFGDDDIYGPFIIDGGLAYFGQLYNTFYVSVNGYITLGRALSSHYPPSASWPSLPVIAPLWADIQTGPETNSSPSSFIEISEKITNKTVLNSISDAAQKCVAKAFAVTWRNAVPYPYNLTFKHEIADFQVIVATDNEQTFVMYNYDQKLFNWTKSFERRVAIGYSMENFGGHVQFITDNFTRVNKESNTGINGRWVFNVTSSAADAKMKCYNAIKNISIKDLESLRAKAEPCPCSYAQAIRDRRFRLMQHGSMHKFVSRFQQSVNGSWLVQQCHYSSFGSLVTGYKEGGYLNIKDNANFQALQGACCTNPPSGCQNLFYNVHPSDTCVRYRPPAWAPAWGDPHIKTLDGAEYTFNGRGEYILVRSNNSFEVQVRTDNINNNTDASIFAGLALRNGPDGDTLSIIRNTSTKQVEIYINESHYDTFNAGTWLNITTNGFEVYSDVNTTDTIHIDLKSQLSLKVTVSDILDIVASMPKSNNAEGLLGNNDGNNKNDYVHRNGTLVNSSATEEELFKFGTSWRINESESLFNGTYGSELFAFYNNDKIRPSNFISDSVGHENKLEEYFKNCSTKVNFTVAKHICKNNTACMVDTAATCDSSFGNKTLMTDVSETAAAHQLENNPPMISIAGKDGTNIVFITNGEDFHLMLNVTDDQDLHVNATLETNCTYNKYEANNLTMKRDFVKTLRDQVISLKFIATDSMNASSELQPIIYYCGCNKSSQCNFEFILEDRKVSDNFYRARCNCSEGETDQYCDVAVTECDRCYNGTSCDNGTCGNCPQGLYGDGQKCFDVDECYEQICDQYCNNKLGSFECLCDAGYELKNSTHCQNIDECENRLDNCAVDKICVDTIGSYVCKCKPGYGELADGTCFRAQHVFGGILVFYVSESQNNDTKIRESVIGYLNETFHTKVGTLEISVHRLNISSNRRRRQTDAKKSNKMQADFILYTKNSVTYQQIENAWNEKSISSRDLLIQTDSSELYSDSVGGACKIEGSNACVESTTDCVSSNNSLTCKCKTGFEEWEIAYTSCKDVNECNPKHDVCGNGDCTNTPGSFTCKCQPGYQYDGSHKCTDMCDPNPCKNDGQCVHGKLENQYICKCTDSWTGQNCDEEDAESKKLKTIAIAVGSVFGAGCLLLLCVVFGMYRRNKALRGDYFTRRPLSTDFDDSHYDLRPTSIPLRKHDFPIDDDDTNTAFSIPRPNVTTNAYDPVGQKSAYDLLEEQEAAKGGETKPLTEDSKAEGEELGKENPSFLHSEASTSVQRKSSKNPYEYF